MVNYKRLLSRIESEKKELKERRIFIPSQLSPSKIKQERREISKEMLDLSGKATKLKKEQKEKEKSRKKFQKTLSKLARKKIISRRIFKKERPTLTIQHKEVPSVLGDPNRFFKDEMEEVKKTIFLK